MPQFEDRPVPKTVVITQSNYLPWRGYFDLLRSADEVVLLDCVQYTRRDWRNRNRIKTAQGMTWLTVPVETKGQYLQSIDETRISDGQWATKHIRTIEAAYSRALHYDELAPWLFDLLRSVSAEPLLTKVNERLLRALCERLGIAVPIRRCSDVLDRNALRSMRSTERLLAIATELGSTRYLSGPSAQEYLDIGVFEAAGIQVSWMNYDGYPSYSQLWGIFEPQISIIDLLLNTGPEAPRYLERTPLIRGK
jgi:WbqC-like protein family